MLETLGLIVKYQSVFHKMLNETSKVPLLAKFFGDREQFATLSDFFRMEGLHSSVGVLVIRFLSRPSEPAYRGFAAGFLGFAG